MNKSYRKNSVHLDSSAGPKVKMLAVESGVDHSYLVSASFLDFEVLSQPCSMKDSSSMAFTSHSESRFYTIR